MMNEELKKISVDRYTWYNAPRNVSVSPLRFFYPRNKEDIVKIIQYAEGQNRTLRVRAVGSGHSYSEAAVGKDCLLNMKRMDKAWKTPQDKIRPEHADKHLVTAQAGMILKKLIRALDKMDLALPNMGVIDFQTISGALMTGTHGTGINKPAIPDMVRAIRLVGNEGKLYQIEPSDGISDPTKHNEQEHGKLIQDDDQFYSTVLSFGAMGIVYELILEVRKQYWLKEKRYMTTWKKLKAQLEDGSFMEKVRTVDFVACRVNPYEVKGEHRCTILEQKILPEVYTGWSARRRTNISALLGNLEFLLESTIRKMNKLRKAKNIGKTINLSMWASQIFGYEGKSYQVLLDSSVSIARYGISSEFAFDAEADKIIEVITNIFQLAKENEEKGGLYQSSHIPIRFVPASKAYLSSAFKRDTVYIDVPLLYGTPADEEILQRYQKMMVDELGAIPHWGKHNKRLYLRQDVIRDHFGKVDDWMTVRAQRDRKGTFLNDFIVQLGLAEEPQQMNKSIPNV
jgi:hypothetical protein